MSASQTDKALQIWVYTLWIEFSTRGENFFQLVLALIEKDGRNEYGRVAPPEIVPIHLK